MKTALYAPSSPTAWAWREHLQSGWERLETAGLERVISPALSLAEADYSQAMTDFYLEEARAAITAARWVMADEEGEGDEAARLLVEADAALTNAEIAEIETQISLIEAERALTDWECCTTDPECSLADRECCTTDPECSLADRECCTTDPECSLADRACRNTDAAFPSADAECQKIDANPPEGLPLWTHPFTLRRTPPWLFGVLT